MKVLSVQMSKNIYTLLTYCLFITVGIVLGTRTLPITVGKATGINGLA